MPCVLFGRQTGHNSGKLDKLFKSPLTLWSSAHSKFIKHQNGCKMHARASLDLADTGKPAINVQLNNILNDRIAKNREKLKPIIDCVIVLGKQNIAFTGHRDNGANMLTNNPGNFQAILDLIVTSGNNVLEEHFLTTPKNATCRRKTIQNQIMSCCGQFNLQTLVKEIKQAGCFSILADETPECANLEQMPVVIRFVDVNAVIMEFVQFVECDTA